MLCSKILNVLNWQTRPDERVSRAGCALCCLGAALGMLGCSEDAGPSPESVDVASLSGGTNVEGFALFADPGSDQSTADIHDFNGDLVRINPERRALVWAQDGSEISGWSTLDEFILLWDVAPFAFRVAFGSEGGERRAYFTEVTSGTVCDLYLTEMEPGLAIAGTGQLPPND